MNLSTLQVPAVIVVTETTASLFSQRLAAIGAFINGKNF